MSKRTVELVGWVLFTSSALFFCIIARDLLAALAAGTFLGGCVAFLVAHFKSGE